MWQDLLDVFAQLNQAYKKILQLAAKKHQFLVTIQMEGLETLLKQEQKLVAHVQALEKQRQALLGRMAAMDKRIQSHTQMGELCALAPRREIREALERAHAELDRCVSEVKAKNEINEILIMGALDAVNANLNRLGGARVEPAYGSGGQNIVTHRKNFEFRA